eukprot:7973018-Pyramimonas_sp.AAC.1
MRRDSAHLCYGPHSQAAHLAELQAQADEEAVALGGPPEELPDEEGPVPPPRVVANPKTSTMDDLYHDLEAVPFPDERIKDARVKFPSSSSAPRPRKGLEAIRRPTPAFLATLFCSSCTGVARREERQRDSAHPRFLAGSFRPRIPCARVPRVLQHAPHSCDACRGKIERGVALQLVWIMVSVPASCYHLRQQTPGTAATPSFERPQLAPAQPLRGSVY